MSANATNTASPGAAKPRLDSPSRILKILEASWRAEMRGYYTYRALAERESDPSRRAAFHTLAYFPGVLIGRITGVGI